MSFGGRKLLATEARVSLLEKLLITANWGMKRFERYTGFGKRVIIKLPHAAEVAVLRRADLPLRL